MCIRDRNIPQLHQPADYLVERSLIGNVELLRVRGTLLLRISSDGGSRASADLGNAEPENLFSDRLVFPGRNDHAGVRHCDADERADFGEGFVADAALKGIRIDVVGMLDARDADGVRSDAVNGFQMLCVHQQAGKLIPIAFQRCV